MTVSIFGVTHGSVRRHHFGQQTDFSATTSPTSTTVGEKIDAQAARLEGKLRLKGITASAITDTASAAYIWCADTLRLMTAISIQPVALGIDSDEAARWRADLKERLADLEERGADALGDGATADATASEPEGPITHFTENTGIDTGDDDDASDAEPPLRFGDEL